MGNYQDISPQEAEAIIKRIFAVAELLAKGISNQQTSANERKGCEKHEKENVLYCESEQVFDET